MVGREHPADEVVSRDFGTHFGGDGAVLNGGITHRWRLDGTRMSPKCAKCPLATLPVQVVMVPAPVTPSSRSHDAPRRRDPELALAHEWPYAMVRPAIAPVEP